MFFGQAQNLYVVVTIHTILMLVNYLAEGLREEVKEPQSSYLVMLGMLLFLPNLGLHWLDFKKSEWKIDSVAVHCLQQHLVAKFLNYDEQGRSDISSTQEIYAILQDVPVLVRDGYMNMLEV